MMGNYWITAVFTLTVVFQAALRIELAETETCRSLPVRGRSADCPSLNGNGTIVTTIPKCYNHCKNTAECQSYTYKMDYTICALHQCPYFQTSNEEDTTYFRKVCPDGSCYMENEATGMDANCTSPSEVINVSRDSCLQTCAESMTCEGLTVKSVRLCALFNCTTSIQTDFTHLFFISNCTGPWMFGFSQREGVIFTPACYYDDRGLGTRGSCSDDVIDDVHQNFTVAGCQTICDSSEDCQGITFQEDQHVCRLHVCSDTYVRVNDSLSSFYTKRCESSKQFGTVGARTRATCPDWKSTNSFQVWTHLDCQIACLRQSGCNGVTVQPTRKWTCFLQPCDESINIDDPDFSFFSKNHTGTGFTAHGSNKIGRCSFLENTFALNLDVDECSDTCSNIAECQGFVIQQKRLTCKFHSCKSYVNMTGFRQYTFYWKIDDSTASESTLSFIEPELPTEAPLLEKHFVARNIECDFQPTTNLSEICTSINDDSVLVSNESDCFHLCEMKDKCSGVTLRSVGITCYLQYCGEPENTTNVYLRFLSKQVTRNCSYTSKGPGTDGECGYISSTTSSLEQCQDTCTHQPDCRGIGYDTSTMLCRPSICPQYQYRQGISDSLSFYTKVCEDVVYYVNHGHNSVGSCGSFDTIQVRTENECQSLCSDNQHCLGVTLNEPRYECQQYTCPTASPSVYTNGTSYLKVCGSKSDTTMYTHTSVVSTIDVMSPSSTAADTTTSISYSQYEVTPLTSRSTSLYETLQLFPSQTSSYNNMVLSQSSHESESGTQQVTSSQNSLYDTTYATSSQVESLLYEATHMTSRPTIPYDSTHNHVSQYETTHLMSSVSSSYETTGINYMNPGLISQYETSYVTPSYFNRYETTGMNLSDVSQYEKIGMTFNPTIQNETTNLISSSSSTYEPTEISPSSVSQYDTTHLASSYTKSYQTIEILPSRVSDTSQQTQISLHETTQLIPSEYSFFSTTTIAAIESVTPSLELPMTLSSVENSHSTFINIEGISISETTATVIEDSLTRAAGSCTEHSIYVTSSLHSINSYVEESVTTSHAVPSATLSSYQSKMNSNLMVFHGEFCSCICRMENKTIHARIRELISTIKVDKSQLSSSTRKLVSVDDRRTSSKNIGTVGIALLATIGFVIVLSDVFAIFCKQ